LYAFRKWDGHLLWTQATGGVVTSPVLWGGVVYAEGGQTINAFKADTGQVPWSVPLQGAHATSPAVAAGRVFVSTDAERLAALDATTGALLWTKKIDSVNTASPVVSGSTVYQCTGKGLTAFGVYRGRRLWFTAGACRDNGKPAVANGVIYTTFSDGPLRAFSAATGALLWTGGSTDRFYVAPPVVANGVVYVTAVGGTLAAHDVATHALLRTSPRLLLEIGSPAVAGGRLYAPAPGMLYAFAPTPSRHA
jgi:outer membrane protein assembly factor BamB